MKGVPKFCAVCGHKALGKNFGALSCEPCKAFFRRNALKDNDFIVNEEEKDWRRVKNFRANPKTTDITDNLSSDQSCEPSDPSPDINDCLYDLLDDNSFSVDELNKQIMDIESGFISSSQMEIIAKTNDNTEISDEVMQRAVEFELAVIPIARPVAEYHNPFNETESHLLSELMNSVKLIGQPMSKVTMEITNFDEYNRTVSYKFDRGVRNMARAAKGLRGFRALHLDDQINLLKYGCIEALLMRTIKHVDYGRQLVILPWDGENSLTYGIPTPRQQHVYMYLLQRYLILKYQSECEAKTRFLRLMNVLSDINLMREIQRRHAMHLYQLSLVTPLLQEVFDILPTPMEPMGKNFGALSCEPCKAFFRRNSFKEWVANEEERELKRLIKLTISGINNTNDGNQVLKSAINLSQDIWDENDSTNTTTIDTDFMSEILDDNNFSVDALNEQIMDIETSFCANDCIDSQVINRSDYQTNHISTDNHQNSENYTQNSLTHYSPERVDEKVVSDYEMPVIPIGRPIDGHKSDFNEIEMRMVTEVIQSATNMGGPYAKLVFEIDDNHSFQTVFSAKFDKCVRNVTKATKGLTAFNTICEDDRILLLKYSCIEVIFLRSILYFNGNIDYLKLPMDMERSFIITMKLQQHIYMYLLQRYLLLKYQSESVAKTRFSQFMNILTELNVLRDIQRTHTLDQSLNVTPLLLEVLDLKPNQIFYK
ncbi:unnamed protein product [Medioppia subpectinata]|uniref:Nuclear receptor domain-containing protein n=1 Tax=Medioppia subpectinata TaxID=1979941 RepID=A0A7R9PTQ7_9ACAR|nr:unnamed protein product [Medioppia subpectinata]CAG2100788.1 unnamed protein product [Medioppia subpectinata]